MAECNHYWTVTSPCAHCQTVEIAALRALVCEGRAAHDARGCFVNRRGTDHRCAWCIKFDALDWAREG
jgi:hypothetical protein